METDCFFSIVKRCCSICTQQILRLIINTLKEKILFAISKIKKLVAGKFPMFSPQHWLLIVSSFFYSNQEKGWGGRWHAHAGIVGNLSTLRQPVSWRKHTQNYKRIFLTVFLLLLLLLKAISIMKSNMLFLSKLSATWLVIFIKKWRNRFLFPYVRGFFVVVFCLFFFF